MGLPVVCALFLGVLELLPGRVRCCTDTSFWFFVFTSVYVLLEAVKWERFVAVDDIFNKVPVVLRIINVIAEWERRRGPGKWGLLCPLYILCLTG